MVGYEKYRESGVEWIGEVPEGWATVRMKFLFRDYSEKNKPEETLLSVTQDQGVVPRTSVSSRMVMPSGNLESFKFIQEGDFAISLRSFEGGLEYCHHDGIISPAYTVLKIKNGLHRPYYKWLLKSASFISEIQTSVVGITMVRCDFSRMHGSINKSGEPYFGSYHTSKTHGSPNEGCFPR